MTVTSPLRRAQRTWKLFALALLGALLLALLPAASQADTGGPTPGSGKVKDNSGSLVFGMGPANHVPPKQIVDGRAYLVYSANPGATILDRVALFNYKDTPLTVQVYATDALQGADGGFGLLTGDKTPADAGAWIKLLGVPKNGKVTIPARSGKKPYGVRYVRFIGNIPLKATPGDHVGGIVASLKSTSTNKTGPKVTLDQRIGLRTYFTLTGKLDPTVAIEDLHASYASNWDPLGRSKYTVTYYLHNKGNLRLHVAQDVTVNRCIIPHLLCPVGALVGHPPTQAELLPGTRLKMTQTFHRKFGLGRPSATVTLHVRALDPSYAKAIPDVTASAGFWAWPWLLILEILLVLLLIGLGGWRYWRRRQRRAVEQAIAASAPAPKHAAPTAQNVAGTRRSLGRRPHVRDTLTRRSARTRG